MCAADFHAKRGISIEPLALLRDHRHAERCRKREQEYKYISNLHRDLHRGEFFGVNPKCCWISSVTSTPGSCFSSVWLRWYLYSQHLGRHSMWHPTPSSSSSYHARSGSANHFVLPSRTPPPILLCENS